jgi:hypothetical protein
MRDGESRMSSEDNEANGEATRRKTRMSTLRRRLRMSQRSMYQRR